MRAVVFGAGYAGLTVARRLERRGPDELDLVVVDQSNTHLVQHELHRVVRRPELAETISLPLDGVLTDATVRQARVTSVDADAGVATLLAADGTETELEYDFGAVCLGAETAFYDLPGVEDHATPLKSIADARAIHRDAMAASGGNAVVGGGGLAGVQVAGELAALSAAEGLDLDVTVVERNDEVAPGFDPAFRSAVRRELDARDVTVETGVAVESADDGAVQLGDGRSLSHDVFVWTGGIRGPAALGGDRPRVGPDLRVSESTVVVGDAGTVVGADGAVAPASAQTAVRQGAVAATALLRDIDDGERSNGDEGDAEPSATYEHEGAGWVVSVGDGAVAQVGPVVLSGEPARAAKAVIGAGHLGSVGAVGNAVDLVAEEFGWPTHDSVVGLSELPTKRLPTDPASPSDLQSILAGTGFALADAFAPGDAVDLTLATRLGDRTYPGSPANLLGRVVSSPFSILGGRREGR
ncbi:NAD(P)/FAD-dependent oxidoreductase [Halorientalis salina]|uniref:NAD(P)/FAD-dependent oxidoreductase n=1 Tax=Halorientalis salina TaxID=2932266 RepID=UPI00277B49B2|nr:FAD-dependent oxidoreductase [Halorientalis salina]